MIRRRDVVLPPTFIAVGLSTFFGRVHWKATYLPPSTAQRLVTFERRGLLGRTGGGTGAAARPRVVIESGQRTFFDTLLDFFTEIFSENF